jgi:hypothetical protein
MHPAVCMAGSSAQGLRDWLEAKVWRAIAVSNRLRILYLWRLQNTRDRNP